MRTSQMVEQALPVEDYAAPAASARPLLHHRGIITGAGRGIGAELAERFARAGASLLLTELPGEMERLTAHADKIRSRYGTPVVCETLDVREAGQIKSVVRIAEEQLGGLELLINNAGVNLLAPSLHVTPEQWDWVVDINLKGNFFMTQEAAKLMVKRKSGSIVFIASQHGVVGNEQRAPYCASKGGLVNLTRALAVEWARYGLRVNCVSPTFVHTHGNDDVMNDANFQRLNLPRIPLRRFARPEDVAEAVLFLASPSSGMITGHNLLVDGGWTAQ